MADFHWEWWDCTIRTQTGTYTYSFKARNKETVIKQINKFVKECNSEKNKTLPWDKQRTPILEVYWDTLKLDRVGYQRLS